ncbi:MAG: DUF6444 domain-containing protein [Pirellulaceae bacterium]
MEELIARQSLEAQAFIRALLARFATVEAELTILRRQVHGKTPQNSSLPPSTQHPHSRPQPRKRKSKKPRAEQPGHPKHERQLIPTAKCDHVEVLRPSACRRCVETLRGTDPHPLRHKVLELQDTRPEVTEYQLHRLPCARCGETTCEELPVGVPQGQ